MTQLVAEQPTPLEAVEAFHSGPPARSIVELHALRVVVVAHLPCVAHDLTRALRGPLEEVQVHVHGHGPGVLLARHEAAHRVFDVHLEPTELPADRVDTPWQAEEPEGVVELVRL